MISIRLRAFIQHNVSSIEQLELLLALAGAKGESVTAEQLAERIKGHIDSIRHRLGILVEKKLVSLREPSGYRFDPANPELETLTHELGAAYSHRRFTVINLIYSGKPDPLMEFADAFRVRKETEWQPRFTS